MHDGHLIIDMSKLPKYDFNRVLYKPSVFRDIVDYVIRTGESIAESIRRSGKSIVEKIYSTR